MSSVTLAWGLYWCMLLLLLVLVLGQAQVMAVTVHVCQVHDAAVNLTGCVDAIAVSGEDFEDAIAGAGAGAGAGVGSACTCTLRSALSYCTTPAMYSTSASEACMIVLPINSTLWLNASYGELSVSETSNFVIDGRGSVVTPYREVDVEVEDTVDWAGENCTMVSVEVRDSFGDGWQGNKLYFTSAQMSAFVTLEEGFVAVKSICLPDGTYTPFACGGRWPSEVSWRISSFDIFGGADDLCSPGAASHDSFTIGDGTGHGGVLQPVMKFFVAQPPPDKNTNISFEMRNFTVQGFGYLESVSGGGAMHIAGIEEALFNHVHFADNTGRDGGAVYLQDVSMIAFRSCSFSMNTAFEGGGIYLNENAHNLMIEDIIVTDCAAYNNGGFLHAQVTNDHLTVSFSQFLNNEASNQGGVFYLHDTNDYFKVVYSDFLNNRAYHGGAVQMNANNNNMVVDNCRFINNSAKNGGAIRFESHNNENEIVRSVFEGNDADNDGGAIYYRSSNLYCSIKVTRFKRNSASNYGGSMVVYSQNNNFVLSNNSFVEEAAVEFGGAVFMDSNHINVTIADCSFVSSTAQLGGALFFETSNEAVTLSNCDISLCTAVRDGGGIYLDSGNINFIFHEVVLNDNHAVNGGGMFVDTDNNNLLLENVKMNGNSATGIGGALAVWVNNKFLKITGCSIIGNSAKSGGGVYFEASNTNANVFASSFASNTAVEYGGNLYFGESHINTILKGINVTDGHSRYGGGVYVTILNSDWLIEQCHFRSNVATAVAGGLYIDGMKRLRLWQSDFASNSALIGGAMHLKDGEDIVLSNSSYMSNEGSLLSGGQGGAMTMYFCLNVSIDSSTFDSNTAWTGAAVYSVQTSELHVMRSRFTNNAAPDAGGALLVENNNVVNIFNSTFFSNLGSAGGSIAMSESSDVEIKLSAFIANQASSLSGSALLVKGTQLSLENNSFTENEALKGGGTVFWMYDINVKEPSGLFTAGNYFSTNRALYGSLVATQGVQLAMSDNDKHLFLDDYDSPAPPFSVRMQDYYGQLDLTETSNFIEIYVNDDTSDCAGHGGMVTGEVIERFKKGVGNFTALQARCAPGHALMLTAVVDIDVLLLRQAIQIDFRNCTRGEYILNGECVACPFGTFSFAEGPSLQRLSQSEVCRPCPNDAVECHGASILVSSGFWRINNDSSKLFECPHGSDSCRGGYSSGQDTCSTGYEGPLCSLCSGGYFLASTTRQCELCGNNDKSAWLDPVVIAVTCVLFLVTLLWLYHFYAWLKGLQVRTIDEALLVIMLRFSSLDISRFNSDKDSLKLFVREKKRYCQILLKTYLTFYQIISQLPEVLGLQFPDAYNYLVSPLNILNLSFLTNFTFIDCSSGKGYDYIDRLYISTMYPVIWFAGLRLVQEIHLYVKYKWDRPQSALRIAAKYFRLMLFGLHIVLPALSVKIFRMFGCSDLDPEDTTPEDDLYLTADMSISCSSTRYKTALIYTMLCVLLYPVGVPCMYFFLLNQRRDDIVARDDQRQDKEDEKAREIRIEPLQGLFYAYKQEFWYFEVVETLYRLSLTGFLLVLGRGTSTQIVIGIAIAFGYAKIQEKALPYGSTSLGNRKVFSLWQICVLLVLAMLVKADFSDENRAIVLIIIILGVCSNLIMDFYNLAVVYWINHKTSMQDIILMSASEHTRTQSRSNNKVTSKDAVISPLFFGDNHGLNSREAHKESDGGIRDSQL